MCKILTRTVNLGDYPVTHHRMTSPCDDPSISGAGSMYFALALLVPCYIIYQVECYFCPLVSELSQSSTAGEVRSVVEGLREAQAIIWWKAVCYHYVRRSRHTTRFRDGSAFSTAHHEVYYQRINSSTAESSFVFSRCGAKDVSMKLVDLSRFPFTKLKMTMASDFISRVHKTCLCATDRRKFQEHEHRDTFMEMREGLDLKDLSFKEEILVRRDGRLPWYVLPVVYHIASVAVLSWPLRMLIEFNTARAHYQVTKLFGVNYPEGVDDHRASRSSMSADSHDIELNIAENCSVAPSYSEALLMVTPPSPSARDANGNVSTQQRRGSVSDNPSASVQLQQNTSAVVVYRSSPLPPRKPDDPFEGRWCCWPEGGPCGAFVPPPCYEEALQVCQPLRNSSRSIASTSPGHFRTLALGQASYQALGQPLSQALDHPQSPPPEAEVPPPERSKNPLMRRSFSDKNLMQSASRWLFPRRSCHSALEVDL
ncbi:Transmembrane protein 151 [Trinorchestia longiramus]|nr:Transmembrane protein 151 [Trinorchestia longiramus]